MSWLVETLLLDRDTIRSTQELDSDDYLNLIVVEQRFEELVAKGNISSFESAIVNFVLSGLSFTKLGKILGMARSTVSKHFSSTCSKISYSLGGEFTDEGYIQFMKEKYNLTSKQCETLKTYMVSHLRHKLRRHDGE